MPVRQGMRRRLLRLAMDADTLALALVRPFEAFIYNDAAIGIGGDRERPMLVRAALLGVEDEDEGSG
jgi:hypothetical protein